MTAKISMDLELRLRFPSTVDPSVARDLYSRWTDVLLREIKQGAFFPHWDWTHAESLLSSMEKLPDGDLEAVLSVTGMVVE